MCLKCLLGSSQKYYFLSRCSLAKNMYIKIHNDRTKRSASGRARKQPIEDVHRFMLARNTYKNMVCAHRHTICSAMVDHKLAHIALCAKIFANEGYVEDTRQRRDATRDVSKSDGFCRFSRNHQSRHALVVGYSLNICAI